MPKRQNSFARALADAEKRLVKALSELASCQNRTTELSTEIPRLRQIIAALGGKVVMPDARQLSTLGATGVYGAETSADLLALAGPQDLTGLGSIVGEKPVQSAITEDELLPDPDGTPLAGE